MRGKLVALLVGAIGIVSFGQAAPASAIDSTRDCDKYAIVNCGTMSTSEIKEKYSDGDNDKVFSAFGIKKSDIGGDIRNGVVYRDGRVVVDGKTVATGAVMAARHLGGSSIAGSETAKKVSVSKMSDAQTAFVKFDANGRFEWAIMKPCGNPVTATPPPAPKPAAECVSLKATPLSRDQYKLSAKASVKNGATISKYTFTLKDGNGKTVGQRTVTTSAHSASIDTDKGLQAGTYTASVVVATSEGNKTSADCAAPFTVKPADNNITVCELATKKSITIKESQFDSSKHSKNFTDCTELPVCELATKRIVTIKESDFDSSKYSKNLDDCKEKPCPIPGKEHLPANAPNCDEEEETPPALPETGMLDTASKLFGITSLAGASAYYVFSRRF